MYVLSVRWLLIPRPWYTPAAAIGTIQPDRAFLFSSSGAFYAFEDASKSGLLSFVISLGL